MHMIMKRCKKSPLSIVHYYLPLAIQLRLITIVELSSIEKITKKKSLQREVADVRQILSKQQQKKNKTIVEENRVQFSREDE